MIVHCNLLIFLLLMMIGWSHESILRGLPFNLPQSKYCNTCDLNTGKQYFHTMKQDEACIGYMFDIQSPYATVDGCMQRLLEDFRNMGSSELIVVIAYMESMRAYQWVFNEPYDLSVMIIPTITDSSCIKMVKSGEGFKRPIPPNISKSNELYQRGIVWEYRFLSYLRDVWVSAVCTTVDHHQSYYGATNSQNRVRTNFERFSDWKVHDYFLRNEVYDPLVNIDFFRPCGDNSSIPPSLSDTLEKCKDQMICHLNPTTRGNPPGQGTSKQLIEDESVMEKSNVDHDHTYAKKLKLDDQTPQLIINEFNPFKYTHNTQEEFIEIRMDPPPGSKKQYFKSVKLICVGAVSQKLLMVANLYKIEIPANGYFYVQSSSLADKTFVHLSSDDHHFKLLPASEKEPIAILLLEMTNSAAQAVTWNSIKLKIQRDGSQLSRDLTGETTVWDVIRDTRIDAQLYGTLKNQQIGNHVQSVLPYRGCNFIIPVGDVDSEIDMTASYNFCKPNYVEPFQYNYFKLGGFTIGLPNDCSRTIDYQVQRVEHVQSNDADTVGLTSTPSAASECPRVKNLIGLLQTQIQAEIDRIVDRYNSEYTTKLYPTNTFKDIVWPEIDKQVVIDLSVIKDLHPFELVTNNGHEHPSTHFRCKVCHQRSMECPNTLTRSQVKSEVADKTVIPTSPSVLKRRMFDHLDSQQHLTSVLYFIQKDRTQLSADKREKLMTDADPEIQQLANVMDITFTFLHTNTAPFNAEAWYETLTKIGANVGGSLHSRNSAYNIVDFIASEGTANIFRYLIFKDQPFTLILDGSADNRNHHYVIVYIQTLEGEVTIPFFAFFLKLGTSFTADSYLDALKNKVDELETMFPGFKSYFMHRLVAVATDSASVMELFHTKLNKWINRSCWNDEKIKIVSIYCLAHKLQLSSRNSIVPLKSDLNVETDSPLHYFSSIEKFMQSSYVWFKWSGKRIGLFRQTIDEEDLPKVEFKELHSERWISSEYSTVKNFVTAWKTARSTLTKMLQDNQRQTKIRDEILTYDMQFRDKTALITIHFLWDFTAAFKVWSEYLQKMAGLLIDQFKYFEMLNDNIRLMKHFGSPVLAEFLSKCECSIDTVGCTLDQYEDAATVYCYGLEFTKTNVYAPKFSVAATALLNKVQEQLNKYIPSEFLAIIYKLHPSQLPASKEALDIQYPASSEADAPFKRVYAGEQVTRLVEMLGLDPNGFLNEWQNLIESIVGLNPWKKLRINHDTNIFWALALQDKDIKWTDRTRYFIRAIKTISPGSVACETGFSIFNNIKTKNRMRLTDSHVESIMKILINGPKSVNEFDSNFYASIWLLRGKTKPMAEIPTKEKQCKAVPEEAFQILDDTELDFESERSLFPFELTPLSYKDVYAKAKNEPDFRDSTKEKRSKDRVRSKIM